MLGASDATEEFFLGLVQAETYLDLYYITSKLPLSWELFEDTDFAVCIKIFLVPSICGCIVVLLSLASFLF